MSALKRSFLCIPALVILLAAPTAFANLSLNGGGDGSGTGNDPNSPAAATAWSGTVNGIHLECSLTRPDVGTLMGGGEQMLVTYTDTQRDKTITFHCFDNIFSNEWECDLKASDGPYTFSNYDFEFPPDWGGSSGAQMCENVISTSGVHAQ